MDKQMAQPGAPKKFPSRVVRTVNKPAQNLAKVHEDGAELTLFKIPVDQVYNAIKGREIVRHLRPLPSKPKDQEPGSTVISTTV